MNVKKITIALLASLACFTGLANANEVRLSANKPINISYRFAYQNAGGEVILSEVQLVRVDQSLTIPINLKNHAVVGIVPVSVDGHVLPDTANRFNQPNQCSMTTDAKKTTGELAFFIKPKEASCKTKGGVFA